MWAACLTPGLAATARALGAAPGSCSQSDSSAARCEAQGGPYLVRRGAEVRLVQVLHRHGARTPFVTLPGMPRPDTPEWSELWGQCRQSPKRVAAASQAAGPAAGSGAMLTSEASGHAAGASAGAYAACGKGQLTRMGEEQLRRLGAFLRREYLEGEDSDGRLLGGAVLPLEGQLQVTSTKTSRTILSVRALLKGFFPEADEASIDPLIEVPWNLSGEILFANYGRCDRLRQLFHVAKDDVNSRLLSIHTRRRLLLETGSVSEKLTFIEAGDPLRALVGQGMPLPGGISEGLAKELDSCGHELVDASHGRDSAEMRRLAMGLLVADIQQRILAAADGSSPQRCVIRSAHDVSISGLLTALGLPSHSWPRFGSSIIIELLKDIQSGEFQVRLVAHDGVPGDPDASKILDLTVPLQNWNATVRPLVIGESDYMLRCALRDGAAAPPAHRW